MEKIRNYKLDNIKVLLIFLVVFGHLLELFKQGTIISDSLFMIIYSFHMGAFLFIGGLLAKFSFKKLFYLLFAYLLLQPFYRINPSLPYSINYLNPQWIMWYLFCYICYFCLVPIIKTENKTNRILIVSISIILSLISGYGEQFGYQFSLSRMLVFSPYFIIGFYMKNYLFKIDNFIKNKKNFYIILPIVLTVLIGLECLICIPNSITDKMIFGAYSYAELGYNPLHRILFLITGLTWIFFLYLVIPNKNIKAITVVGKYTLPIYLIHGLIVAIIIFLDIFKLHEALNILIALIIALALVSLLGNCKVGPILTKIITGQYLILLYQKVKEKYLLKKHQKTT